MQKLWCLLQRRLPEPLRSNESTQCGVMGRVRTVCNQICNRGLLLLESLFV